MDKNVLKTTVHRLAKVQIKIERDQELTSCLSNHSVYDHNIKNFERLNSLEQVSFNDTLNNKQILFLALDRCKSITFCDLIDTQELQDEIQKIIDELK